MAHDSDGLLREETNGSGSAHCGAVAMWCGGTCIVPVASSGGHSPPLHGGGWQQRWDHVAVAVPPHASS
jgi:hypothetical protein